MGPSTMLAFERPSDEHDLFGLTNRRMTIIILTGNGTTLLAMTQLEFMLHLAAPFRRKVPRCR